MWKCGQGDKGYITSTQLFIHFCVYIINGFVNNSINLNEIMLLFNTIKPNQPIPISHFYGKINFHIMVTELDKFLNLLKKFTKCKNVKKTLCTNIIKFAET